MKIIWDNTIEKFSDMSILINKYKPVKKVIYNLTKKRATIVVNEPITQELQAEIASEFQRTNDKKVTEVIFIQQ
jgi:CRISPR/Cas system-associated endonuclease Cas3-HD